MATDPPESLLNESFRVFVCLNTLSFQADVCLCIFLFLGRRLILGNYISATLGVVSATPPRGEQTVASAMRLLAKSEEGNAYTHSHTVHSV